MKALLALVAVACEAPQIDVDVGEGLVLLASTDEAGRVEEAALLRSDRSTVPLLRPKDGFLAAWRLPAGSLIGGDGSEIDEQALRFVRAEEELESCDRCLVPSLQAPQTLLAGDRCRAPSFAEPLLFDASGKPIDRPEIAELARDGTRLVLPGACAHPRFVPEPVRPLELCPLLPIEAPIGTPEFALSDDGTLVGASAGWLWRVAPDGARSFVEVEPIGDVVALGALPGGDFFYGGTRGATFIAGYQYFTIDSSLARVPIDDDVLDGFRALYLAALGDDFILLNGRKHIGGFSSNTEPKIVGCDLSGGGFACTEEEFSGCVVDLGLVTAFDGGAISIGTAFAYRHRGEPIWRCDLDTLDARLPLPGGDVIWQRRGEAVSIGNTLFACGSLSGTSDFALIRIEVPPLAPGQDPTGNIAYSIAYRGPSCFEIMRIPELPDQLLVLTATGAVSLDSSGAITGRYDFQLHPEGGGDPLIPGFGFFSSIVTAGDWLAVGAGFGFVWRRGAGEALSPVYASDIDYNDAALAPGDGGIWWHRGTAAPWLITHAGGNGCDRLSARVPEGTWTYETKASSGTSEGFPQDLAFERAVAALALDEQRHAVIGSSYVRVVDFAERSVVQRPRAGSSFAIGAAPLAKDRILIADADRLWLDSLEDAVEVPLIFDDPATPEEEAPLPLVGWTAVDGVEGVAWVVGPGRIARVVREGEGARAEVYWTHRLPTLTKEVEAQVGFRATAFTGVTVLAPDDVLFFANDVDPSRPNEIIRTVWRISSDLDRGYSNCAGEGPLFICEAEEYEPSIAGDLTRATFAGGQLTFFHELGHIERIGSPRAISPTYLTYGVEQAGRMILMAGYGRLAAAIEAE